jgi:hypothetical protein
MVDDTSHSAHDLSNLFTEAAAEKDHKMPNLRGIIIRYQKRSLLDEHLGGVAARIDDGRRKIDDWSLGQPKESPKNLSVPKLKAELGALSSSVKVSLIQVDGHLYPSFVEGFCKRYGVEEV